MERRGRVEPETGRHHTWVVAVERDVRPHSPRHPQQRSIRRRVRSHHKGATRRHHTSECRIHARRRHRRRITAPPADGSHRQRADLAGVNEIGLLHSLGADPIRTPHRDRRHARHREIHAQHPTPHNPLRIRRDRANRRRGALRGRGIHGELVAHRDRSGARLGRVLQTVDLHRGPAGHREPGDVSVGVGARPGGDRQRRGAVRGASQRGRRSRVPVAVEAEGGVGHRAQGRGHLGA